MAYISTKCRENILDSKKCRCSVGSCSLHVLSFIKLLERYQSYGADTKNSRTDRRMDERMDGRRARSYKADTESKRTDTRTDGGRNIYDPSSTGVRTARQR